MSFRRRESLGWRPIYRIQVLNDPNKAIALCKRAHLRRLDLPEEVVHYLYTIPATR
ncbi:hypothetical protein CCP3SC5AM1_1060002 [Gammaproteobacteria bacterium]